MTSAAAPKAHFAGNSNGDNQNRVEVTYTASTKKEDKTSQQLRQRKKLLAAKAKSRRVDWKKQKWTSRKPKAPTQAQEKVFVGMQLRKLLRKMEGRKAQRQSQTFWNFMVFFLCMAMLVAGDAGHEEAAEATTHELEDYYFIIVLVWGSVSCFLITLMAGTAFVRPLYWMLVYLPILTLTAFVSFYHEGTSALQEIEGETPEEEDQRLLLNFGQFLAILLLIVEVLTVTIFVLYYYAYPRFIRSDRFLKPGRPANYWNVKLIGGSADENSWTMTYKEADRKLRKRYTSKYEGDVCPSSGLPHGQGRWYDDAYEGEILTGYWKQGAPVAPFVSHHYGSGNALKAVRIAYFKAHDDPWDIGSGSFFQTNNNPPVVGLAGVECSVSGSFYNHLPLASLLEEPSDVVGQPQFMERIIKELIQFDDNQLHHHSKKTLQIKANDPRGVQVVGHYYEPTGEYYAHEPESITVVIKRKEEPISAFEGGGKFSNFMPRPTLTSKVENIFECDNGQQYFGGTGWSDSESSSVDIENQGQSTNGEEETAKPMQVQTRKSKKDRASRGWTADLKVVGWVPATHKDALVFIPGYASTMKQTLESVGQLVAMSDLGTHVYPIVYNWPAATQLSYPVASHNAASPNNDANFLRLIQGLAAAGVRNVHLMSHSMGVQTLLGVFRNNTSGSTPQRSDVSKCFRLMPAFADEEVDESDLLVCKTITMLNPDFPVAPFVDRGFESIRQICNTITLMADRQDAALLGSSICNGIGCYVGYQQPEVLKPKLPNPSYKLGLQEVVGRSIDLLHFPDEWAISDANPDIEDQHDERLVFQERAPLALSADEEAVDRLWLDMDVIDTTGLDTNIEGIRHGGYNLNSMLLKDIEELIATGNRAMRRSTLLYRDGNQFTYAHAPSFVAV